MNQDIPKFLSDKDFKPNVSINPALNYLGTETAFGFGAEVIAVDSSNKFEHVYKFHVGDTGPKTPQPIIDVAIQALKDKQTKYGHFAGYPQVLENIAKHWSETRGVEIKKENVMLQPGGKPVIELALQALLEPGDKVIVQDPGYPVYESLAEFYNHGGVLRWKAYKNEETQTLEYRVEDLQKLIEENDQVKLLCVNTPQNPTGMMIGQEKLEAIAELVKEHKFYVIFDDIYDQIVFDGRKHFSFLSIPGMLDWTINLNGYSKNYAMTGWRLGFMIAPEWLIEIFGRFAINKWSNVNRMEQIVAGCVFGDVSLDGFDYKSVKEEVQELINKDFVEYEKKGQFVSESLNLLQPYVVCNEAEGAFYLFPSFARVLDLDYVKNELNIKSDVDMRNWLLYERGIATLSGSDFGEMGQGYIRFSYAEDRDAHVVPGMKQILKVVIELIEKSGQEPPLKVDEVDGKIGDLVGKYFG
ncbi:aminotransferase class I/II-fold pyridoxal phosphate-dependent enzyme [Candidatus Parcubacteria bacterium]|jgi:aspartate aminotransferase|nr:aminotransferase class I/II-fold pyridoxal phosphate-dependent enzyme [Candidatus Parcubacteria bacterium]MBT3948907.1 aminotransferase class I/II-fold pyridoxal phosphate-dependent enzyme [Candidatus Parcubacteria bacterium]